MTNVRVRNSRRNFGVRSLEGHLYQSRPHLGLNLEARQIGVNGTRTYAPGLGTRDDDGRRGEHAQQAAIERFQVAQQATRLASPQKLGVFQLQISDYSRGQIPALQQIVLSFVVVVIVCAAGFTYQFSHVEDLRRLRLDQQCARRDKVGGHQKDDHHRQEQGRGYQSEDEPSISLYYTPGIVQPDTLAHLAGEWTVRQKGERWNLTRRVVGQSRHATWRNLRHSRIFNLGPASNSKSAVGF